MILMFNYLLFYFLFFKNIFSCIGSNIIPKIHKPTNHTIYGIYTYISKPKNFPNKLALVINIDIHIKEINI